jgi:hypothetical protein
MSDTDSREDERQRFIHQARMDLTTGKISEKWAEYIAKSCYIMADAMLAERERQK